LNGIESKSTYAHELGHMLGLEHIFFEGEQKKEALNKVNEIINYKKNNIKKCEEEIIKGKKYNQVSDENINPKPLKNQSKSLTTFSKYSIKKQTLQECLNNTNNYIIERIKYRSEQINYYTVKLSDKKEHSSYSIGEKKVSKAEFKESLQSSLNINQTEKSTLENQLEANKLTLDKLTSIYHNNLHEFQSEYFLTYEDKLKIFNDFLNLKLEKEWQLITSNYLYFNYKSTENIMDYGQVTSDGKDSVKKNKYLSYQITIMRNDYENYK
jgi:Pregnancy-associated plasma protein-A